MLAAIMPSDPEAKGYLLILTGTVLIMIGALALAGWYAGAARHARRQARNARRWEAEVQGWMGDQVRSAQRVLRAERELAEFRRRYGADVNQHFEVTARPLWTRAEPPADQTVIMSAAAETAILTLAGTSLADPT